MGENARAIRPEGAGDEGGVMTESMEMRERGLGSWRRLVGTALLLVVLVSTVSCGWIFSKRGKPMRVEVVFIGGDSLNHDGTRAQPVQVQAYVLRRVEQFNATDVQAFFDPGYMPGFWDNFKTDTLARITLSVAPNEETVTRTMVLFYNKIRDARKVYFGAVANFAEPPRELNRDRVSFELDKKDHKLRIYLGRDYVEKDKSKKKGKTCLIF